MIRPPKNPFLSAEPAERDLLASSRDIYRDLKLTIEMVPIASVKAYTRNARKHSPAQIEQIEQSIKSFGFVVALTVEDDGTLIAGHGRLAAAKRLGRTTVPVVRISHLNDAQKRALRLADNKIGENAGWDEAVLALEFTDLLQLDFVSDLTFDLSATGFAAAEIDRLVELGTSSPDTADEQSEKLIPAPGEAVFGW